MEEGAGRKREEERREEGEGRREEGGRRRVSGWLASWLAGRESIDFDKEVCLFLTKVVILVRRSDIFEKKVLILLRRCDTEVDQP